MKVFDKNELKNLHIPAGESSNEDNGQVTIIGGSKLFHGASLLSLKVASRIVDMVFFATPEKSVGHVAQNLKSKLLSFIWVPWEEVDYYIQKSDALLIGPGFMRFSHESQITNHQLLSNRDEAARITRNITKRLLSKFPNKKWVIDAGSLQVMDKEWIPERSILTPNRREFELLFDVKLPRKGDEYYEVDTEDMVNIYAHRYKCIVVLKGPKTIVSSPEYSREIKGGNPGMTKGGTGDVLAGLTVALLAKNEAFLAASAASFIAKNSADELYKKVGVNYNADDLADKIPETIQKLTS